MFELQDMNRQETALALSNAYRLLGDLFLKSPDRDTLELLADIQEFESVLDGLDTEELAAEYYQLLGLNVFPYEDIYLGTDNLIGGEASDRVRDLFNEIGFAVPFDDHAGASHFGKELQALSFLYGAEPDAWEDDEIASARRMQSLEVRLLNQHIMRWVLPFTKAIQIHGNPFYSRIARLTCELLLDDWRGLNASQIIDHEPFQLPDRPDILHDEKAGIKQLAEYLLTPAYAGIFISRNQISDLASQLDLPRGFGNRLQMLSNLFHASAQYDLVFDLIKSLDTILDDWKGFYEEINENDLARGWYKRVTETQTLLEDMKEHILVMEQNQDD